MEEFANLGDIVNTVGLRGEIKLLPGPDFWPGALKFGKLYLVTDIFRRSVNVEKFRKKGGTYVIKLDFLQSIEDAETAVGKRLELAMEELDSESYPDQTLLSRTLGKRIFMKNGDLLGIVVNFLSSGGQDRLIVEGEKNYIIPFVSGIVTDVDYKNDKIEIDPPEGLLELEW
ncbi:MAG: ribosome maturation factor RimM [Candidatus Krumholzibacteriota bacterium]|nr:ribosome maturation factor RimM [Candidatus Krumholzibacteriota bacterium]